MRLAIILSHPVQYYVPWIRALTTHTNLEVKVYYLWNAGVSQTYDPGFQREIKWDIDLLQGYDYEYVPNVSSIPGTDTFWGINNPDLPDKLAAFSPDAILMYGYNYPSHLRVLFSKKLKSIPIFLRGDSHLLSGQKSWWKMKLLTCLFKRFSAFLSVGAAHDRYLHSLGVPAEKIFRCPHAVDVERFKRSENVLQISNELRASLAITESDIVFLYAGKSTGKKQVTHLCKAFLALNAPKSVLVLAGSGEKESELRSLAEGSEKIHLRSFSNQSEMPALYAMADIFVLPSYGPYETWGLAVQEAMSMDVPAIVSSHVGCAEDLIIAQKTGLIFEAGNEKDLMIKMNMALSDHKLRSTMSENSRAHVEANYTYSHATDGLLEALKQVCHTSECI